MTSPLRVVGIFLVDARGWVLLQERDEHAPVAPEQWGIVGGHVEPGEDFETAMRRELVEETGLVLPDGLLHLWHEGVRDEAVARGPVHWQLWAGRVDLVDDDIVVGEGRRIVFVAPADIAALDLSESTRHFLPRFLASGTYRRLSAGTCP